MTVFYALLLISTFNAYFLLALSKDHLLFFIGKYIPLQCEPCKMFWLSVIETIGILVFYLSYFQTDYSILLIFPFISFLISGLSMVFYKFIS